MLNRQACRNLLFEPDVRPSSWLYGVGGKGLGVGGGTFPASGGKGHQRWMELLMGRGRWP